MDRRDFLKIAGLTTLGLASNHISQLFASEPAAAAAPGTIRWAMVVDLRNCKASEGCRDCIAACHQGHNVPELPDKRHHIKWIWTDKHKNLFPGQDHAHFQESMQTKDIVALCNHCDNPPCVRVCPTQATFKDEKTGIVIVDPHRCIGCRYCIAACPYGARSFNWKNPRPFIKSPNLEYPPREKGVVEKCNFCAERLSKSLAPLCVGACKHKALTFGDVNDPKSEVRALLKTHYTIRRKPGLGTNPQVYYIV